jgi:uncharacterized protein YjiS (DUF1127 family)
MAICHSIARQRECSARRRIWRQRGAALAKEASMNSFAAFCFEENPGRRGLGRSLGAAIVRALLWPARVVAARRTLAQLSGLSEYELRDIGLSQQDLVDFTARPLDEDPTPHLARSRAARMRARAAAQAHSSPAPSARPIHHAEKEPHFRTS